MFVDVYLWPVPAGAVNDPWLRDPTAGAATAALPRDDKPKRRRRQEIVPERPRIEAVTLYGDLTKRYGITDGTRIYYEMREQRKGPFGEGKKYAVPKPKTLKRMRRL